jgi:hypothetical protein
MTTLHLGVIDMPYNNPDKGFKGNKPSAAHSNEYENITTGEVAEDLERRYGIMDAFIKAYSDDIGRDIENSLKGAFETMAMGGNVGQSNYSAATSDIEAKFKNFLSSQEVEAVGISGVPTKAAQLGVRHRYKNPYGRTVGRGANKIFVQNPPRPSFIDTGLYQASFKAWVD